MAGDWIKMRGNLWDDPRVSKLCDLCGCPEALIVGGLYWLWATADQHTESGVLPQLSTRQIDRKTSIPGFGAALVVIGWIVEQEDGIQLVRFEEHNGASAKKRAVTAKRVANHRSGNADVTLPALPDDDTSVRGALAREREEEEKKKDSVPNGTGAEAPTKADPVKQEIWDAGRSLLTASRMPAKQVGTFLGKLVNDYTAPVVLDAVRAAVKDQPADAAEYLKACCLHAKGQRKLAEPEWRAEQRQRTQIAAPGVAAGAPASQFFIDVDARQVATPALTRSPQ